MTEEYPMRINKYLAHKGHATRKEADALITAGKVIINDRLAQLGDKVEADDTVVVRAVQKGRHYWAFHKPREIVTLATYKDEKDVMSVAKIPGVFPIGRLDKESNGLLILTDDGRITDRLLNPDRVHEKEYEVRVREELPHDFKSKMEAGVDIGDYVTRPCTVRILDEHRFAIILTEGKHHQIRRMCDVMHTTIESLTRTRVMNITLGNLSEGASRKIEGEELKTFLQSLGL